MVRKPSYDNKVVPVMPPTTIKPFVSWSTRLQKTTTEDALGKCSFKTRTVPEERVHCSAPGSSDRVPC
jgi:hypothetical protein